MLKKQGCQACDLLQISIEEMVNDKSDCVPISGETLDAQGVGVWA